MNDRHEHYQNRVTIDADRERVFAALTTAEGIEGWWGSACSAACSGAFEVGSRFDVQFGSDGHSLMGSRTWHRMRRCTGPALNRRSLTTRRMPGRTSGPERC